MSYRIADNGRLKIFKSPGYNYIFNKVTGEFARWGVNEDDDPTMAPCPEILDIEIATACDGVPGPNGKAAPCRFCYKANRRQGTVMTLDTYKTLFAKLAPVLSVGLLLEDGTEVSLHPSHKVLLESGAFCAASSLEVGSNINMQGETPTSGKVQQIHRVRSGPHQIAFGITNLYGPSAEHIWDIFEHTREGGVIPNTTINGYGLTEEVADRLAALCGAVAISRYDPKDTCYDAVKTLTDRGMTSVNIHQLVSEETYEGCMEVLRDMRPVDQGGDPRLAKLNAVVFLMLKPKGRGDSLTSLKDPIKYKALVDYALERSLSIGFDSCSVPSFLSAVADHPKYKQFDQATDRCESGLFSLYIDVHGKAWPCSFGQDRHDLESVDVLSDNVRDFSADVWLSPEMDRWRDRLCANCRSCPLYDIDIGPTSH